MKIEIGVFVNEKRAGREYDGFIVIGGKALDFRIVFGTPLADLVSKLETAGSGQEDLMRRSIELNLSDQGYFSSCRC